jgi:hypothetical protein
MLPESEAKKSKGLPSVFGPTAAEIMNQRKQSQGTPTAPHRDACGWRSRFCFAAGARLLQEATRSSESVSGSTKPPPTQEQSSAATAAHSATPTVQRPAAVPSQPTRKDEKATATGTESAKAKAKDTAGNGARAAAPERAAPSHAETDVAAKLAKYERQRREAKDDVRKYERQRKEAEETVCTHCAAACRSEPTLVTRLMAWACRCCAYDAVLRLQVDKLDRKIAKLKEQTRAPMPSTSRGASAPVGAKASTPRASSAAAPSGLTSRGAGGSQSASTQCPKTSAATRTGCRGSLQGSNAISATYRREAAACVVSSAPPVHSILLPQYSPSALPGGTVPQSSTAVASAGCSCA